jgi:EAL domain-containing protein (putative c-di-GMP-specific phosphodiesterase class I)/GGDEF domain-containing protein
MASSIATHVTENIERAIQNGWIRVYYQPVVRSLTEQLCGAESLARWIDPELGFLAPDKFIGALEESGQIHKLDMFMVEQVCSDISDRLKKGLPTVPVSVNFSRLDFEAVDMLGEIEGLVRKYDIPRDYLHIEVTESMIVSDKDLMTKIIEDFRNAGYEVWMDDFGSGYSSLNLLKDYSFDTLKLDMLFLSNFTDKSKAIMTSTITMAKDIEMMTLAEGAETREQVDFLKGIGCDKLQGYFYGKPLPIDEFFEHINNSNIEIEERRWRHYYDVASRCARATDEPLEIVEDDGVNFRTLFMNEPYKREIFTESYSIEEADRLIYNTPSALLKKYREFAGILENTRNVETFYYTNNGNILRFVAQAVAENEGRYIIKGSIHNISSDKSLSKRNSVDSRLKELNHLFEQILQINPSNNTVIPLLGRITYNLHWDPKNTSLDEMFERVGKELISSADYQRYKEFGDFTTMKERVAATEDGYIEDLFRMKDPDGSYNWKVVYIMVVPGTGGKEFLVCKKKIPGYAKSTLTDSRGMFKFEDYGLDSDNADSYIRLFKNFVANSSIKFFWKDRDRRITGVSQAYLNYFEISSFEMLRGKKAEETPWIVDKKMVIEEEEEILRSGTKVENAPSQCIINGVIHNMIINKSPIYSDGKIVGIMGYIIDIGEELNRMDDLYNIEKIDKITGLMTIRAFLNVFVDYSVQRQSKGIDYGMIILREVNHDRIVDYFGEAFGNKVLKAMADEMLSLTGQSCLIARVKDADFGILTHLSEQEDLDILASQLKEKIESVREVDGCSITLNIHTSALVIGTEGTTDENLYSKVLSGLS